MPSGSYIVTGGICAVLALIALSGGNAGGALFFGVGVAINAMLYRRRADREDEEAQWEREQREDARPRPKTITEYGDRKLPFRRY